MNENIKKVLVTGATGFVGSYVCRYLLQQNYSVYATRRASSCLDLIEDIIPDINLINIDSHDLQGLSSMFSEIDAVIHCAALTSIQSSDMDYMFDTNVRLTADLLNLAIDNNIKKFVHISSIAALGQAIKNQPLDEKRHWKNDPRNTQYGLSKHLAEMEVRRAKAEGLNVIMLNPSLVLGAGIWASGTPSVFKKLDNGIPFYPTGKTGVVDVRDVAIAAVKSLQLDTFQDRIIISSENLTTKELFDLICDGLNKKKIARAITPLMGKVACALDAVRSKLTASPRILTKDTLKSSLRQASYNNTRSINILDMKYKLIRDTIEETCQLYKETIKEKKGFAILPLH